jgi:hypothetical protein
MTISEMFHHKKKHLLSFLTIFHDAGEAVTKKMHFMTELALHTFHKNRAMVTRTKAFWVTIKWSPSFQAGPHVNKFQMIYHCELCRCGSRKSSQIFLEFTYRFFSSNGDETKTSVAVTFSLAARCSIFEQSWWNWSGHGDLPRVKAGRIFV